MKLYDLPRDEVAAHAAPEICFQVVSSAGKVIETRDNGDRLIEFEATVGGKTLTTLELVRVVAPERIDYSWVKGPLPAVEETITIVPTADGSLLRYEGRFGIKGAWFARPFVRRSVAKQFSKTVHEHLLQAREIAERRASRSHVYPQQVKK